MKASCKTPCESRMREIRTSGLMRGKEVGGHCLCALIPWLPSLLYLSKILPIIQKIPFGSHRQPLQWLDSIEKIRLLEIEIVRVLTVHPRNLVSRRVSHKVQEEGIFIHHLRVGVKMASIYDIFGIVIHHNRANRWRIDSHKMPKTWARFPQLV